MVAFSDGITEERLEVVTFTVFPSVVTTARLLEVSTRPGTARLIASTPCGQASSASSTRSWSKRIQTLRLSSPVLEGDALDALVRVDLAELLLEDAGVRSSTAAAHRALVVHRDPNDRIGLARESRCACCRRRPRRSRTRSPCPAAALSVRSEELESVAAVLVDVDAGVPAAQTAHRDAHRNGAP